MTMTSDKTTVPRPADSAPLLEVENLAVEFHTRDGVVKAVNGLSFAVESGRTLAIVGESGSGKSVTVQAIMGLLQTPPAQVTGGAVRFRGADLLSVSMSHHQTMSCSHVVISL